MKKPDDFFPDADAAKRRDEVIRRMASTPPQPKSNPHLKKKKKAVVGRAVHKVRAGREG